MAEKLYEYQGCIGRLHVLRDNLKERLNTWKENHPDGLFKSLKEKVLPGKGLSDGQDGVVYEDYSHIYR